MKCYTFWVRETRTIFIGNEQQSIMLVAGSNVSKEDASLNAKRIAQSLEERINNPRRARESYEVVIKEKIDQDIDPRNIITINRYGARVLNTTEYTILDIDRPPSSFLDLFRAKKDPKEKIVARFKACVARHPELGTSFRIYETCAGIRIIGKTYFDPQTRNFENVMRSLSVDPLYRILSRKQNCYRARLTPKPYRMKAETIRIKTPLDCETEAYDAWRKKYAETSQGYSVVRLKETLGSDFGGDPVIALHDTVTRMRANDPLA
ncbi:MAG: hypothetical protein FWH21_08750 [Kiritimatiellaeota bacterium]|nr:hypothetical protein [Kiritimatiellota bacterium]